MFYSLFTLIHTFTVTEVNRHTGQGIFFSARRGWYANYIKKRLGCY